jgi:hypothetical protein
MISSITVSVNETPELRKEVDNDIICTTAVFLVLHDMTSMSSHIFMVILSALKKEVQIRE